MPFSEKCSICNSERKDELEAIGLAAVDGRISWREAARQGDLTHGQGLKNHMESHYESALDQVVAELEQELQDEFAETERELLENLRLAPAEVKPLYLLAIRNLRGVMETKPSQQHLIAALKGIHEITGMRQEQQMLLAFGRKMFGGAPEKVEVERGPDIAALEAAYPVEAEVVE